MILNMRDRYVMLMASLPALGPLLGSPTPAISATRLKDRLRLLAPSDRATLEAMRAATTWGHRDLGESDADFLAGLDRALELVESPTLRAAVRDRMELRTLVAALRRRHAGLPAPAAGELWGFGRFLDTIRANWTRPDFGLARRFPWITAARASLESGDPADLERILLQAAWNSAGRYAQNHFFDFEAVACYVIRWSLADRWSHYDVAAATLRFEELLDAATRDALPAIEMPA